MSVGSPGEDPLAMPESTKEVPLQKELRQCSCPSQATFFPNHRKHRALRATCLGGAPATEMHRETMRQDRAEPLTQRFPAQASSRLLRDRYSEYPFQEDDADRSLRQEFGSM